MAQAVSSRMIILTLETICKIFKDYVGLVGFPEDAKPIKFMFNPQDRKVAIVVETEETVNVPVETIHFDIRRIFGVS